MRRTSLTLLLAFLCVGMFLAVAMGVSASITANRLTDKMSALEKNGLVAREITALPDGTYRVMGPLDHKPQYEVVHSPEFHVVRREKTNGMFVIHQCGKIDGRFKLNAGQVSQLNESGPVE